MCEVPTEAKIHVKGKCVTLACVFCTFTKSYPKGLPGDWDMTHRCKRQDGVWLVIGQMEMREENGK
jgi:hypothetical protein